MAGMKPRQGWIYLINPQRVFLSCKLGHVHFYDLEKPEELHCKTLSCNLTPDVSQIFREEHPYAFWEQSKFKSESDHIQTFTAIPLTFQNTYTGLPTTYPINPTSRNSLEQKLYALTHQIITIDINYLKDLDGNWITRIGQIDKHDKQAIEERLDYALDIEDNPSAYWFINHASPELLRKVFPYLPQD